MTYHIPQTRPAVPSIDSISHVSITLRLADQSSDGLVRHIRLFRDCVALAQRQCGFTVEAAAVLPSEAHLLCAFPDADFGVRNSISLIVTSFDRHMPTHEGSVWAAETEIIEISKAVVALRRTFIEAAPVRAGLVKSAADWPYSSLQADTLQGSQMGVAVA